MKTRLFARVVLILISTVIATGAVLIQTGFAEEIVAYEFTFSGNIDDLYKPTRIHGQVTGSEYDFFSDASSIVGWSGSEGNPGGAFYAATTILSTEALRARRIGVLG